MRKSEVQGIAEGNIGGYRLSSKNQNVPIINLCYLFKMTEPNKEIPVDLSPRKYNKKIWKYFFAPPHGHLTRAPFFDSLSPETLPNSLKQKSCAPFTN
jgi:hypothetical protein